MKVLVIDSGSDALDFCMRCIEWGHSVIWFTAKRENRDKEIVGQGIVDKLYDLDLLRTKYLGWADLIFLTDNTKYLTMLEPYRQMGYPIFAPSTEAAELELDRLLGQKAMKNAGMKIIPSEGFHDYKVASQFVEKHPTYLVSKPSGEADKALSYVADDAASLQYMFERWNKNDKYRSDAHKHGFILQEKKKGCEMAVGGWFGPGGWSQWKYENFESKKLMNGDLGPNTGEQGTVSMYVRDSKLFDVALKPLTKLLHKIEYVGFIDNNGMIDEEGQFWPFELTCRPGWPTFYNQMATHLGDPAQWMLDLLMGADTLEVKENVVCISVVIAIPDYPFSKITKKVLTGIPIYNATDREHVHLCEVMMGQGVPVQVGRDIIRAPNYVTCGDYVAVITGCGDTVRGARRSAYAAVKKIKMPASPFWRTDIGSGRLNEQLPAIQQHGYAQNFVLS
jgi:phosphoribosylamine---glycine ligase